MVQRPTICHFLAMVVDNEILEGQGRGSINDLPRPFLLKSTLFTNSGGGKFVKVPRSCSSRIEMSIIRAFKWGIVYFHVTLGSQANKAYVFYDIQEVRYNWITVYVITHATLFLKYTDFSSPLPSRKNAVRRPYCTKGWDLSESGKQNCELLFYSQFRFWIANGWAICQWKKKH